MPQAKKKKALKPDHVMCGYLRKSNLDYGIFSLAIRLTSNTLFLGLPINARTMSSVHNHRVAKNTGSSTYRTPTCDTCKSRHQKCSGEKPKCSNCRLRGIDCAYSTARTRVPEPSRSSETTFRSPFVSSLSLARS